MHQCARRLPADIAARVVARQEAFLRYGFPRDHPGMVLRARGFFQAVLLRQNGAVEYLEAANLITNGGYDLLCDVLGKNAQPSDITHMGIGTGTTAATAGDTALETEAARVAAVYAHTAGTMVCTFSATFAAGTGTGAITEAGLINASAGGTLFNRAVFSAINKGAADELREVATITFS